MSWPFPSRPWRLQPDNKAFETGDLVAGTLVSIGSDQIAELLAENPAALKCLLEKLATEMAKQVGNNHPLVIALETLIGTHLPPSIPAKPIGQAVDDTEFDGLDGWGCDNAIR